MLILDAKVPDPYRWLEDDKSAETGALKAQNEVTYGIQSNPFRDALKARMENCGITKNRAPSKEGISHITIKTTVCKTSRCCTERCQRNRNGS
jgi:prolyl oligopeptidase PreP (S9A serine peptidase family)